MCHLWVPAEHALCHEVGEVERVADQRHPAEEVGEAEHFEGARHVHDRLEEVQQGRVRGGGGQLGRHVDLAGQHGTYKDVVYITVVDWPRETPNTDPYRFLSLHILLDKSDNFQTKPHSRTWNPIQNIVFQNVMDEQLQSC